VLDLCGDGESRLSRRGARSARDADLVLVGSLAELQEFRQRHPALADRTALFVRPVDLVNNAPLEQLHKLRDAQVKRFRRMHRLAGPMVLFAGPYTREGGLDLALDAVFRLREQTSELRLAAIPHGVIDQDYLDEIERRALALGHHGIVEWSPEPSDVPLWYGLASVVCAPSRSAVDTRAPKLAAAAGRPFVGSDVPGRSDDVVEGRTGFLVPPGDLDSLTAALEAVLGDGDEAKRVGANAREWAEEKLSPAGAARRLRRFWIEGAGRGTQLAAARDRRSS
jgi:glycosyltransferase involved in cell wall biosynthesis